MKALRWHARKDVRLDEWFLKAHFFQDPVQPGSLGLEALFTLLRAASLAFGHLGDAPSRFEPVATGLPIVWRYRGQVTPENRLVQYELELTRVEREGDALLVTADGWLWVDGVRIYAAENLATRFHIAG